MPCVALTVMDLPRVTAARGQAPAGAAARAVARSDLRAHRHRSAPGRAYSTRLGILRGNSFNRTTDPSENQLTECTALASEPAGQPGEAGGLGA